MAIIYNYAGEDINDWKLSKQELSERFKQPVYTYEVHLPVDKKEIIRCHDHWISEHTMNCYFRLNLQIRVIPKHQWLVVENIT